MFGDLIFSCTAFGVITVPPTSSVDWRTACPAADSFVEIQKRVNNNRRCSTETTYCSESAGIQRSYSGFDSGFDAGFGI
jgi:hypothetical protein